MCSGGCESQPGTESLDYSVISSHELCSSRTGKSLCQKVTVVARAEQSRGDQARAGRPGPDFLRTLVVVGRAKDV